MLWGLWRAVIYVFSRKYQPSFPDGQLGLRACGSTLLLVPEPGRQPRLLVVFWESKLVQGHGGSRECFSSLWLLKSLPLVNV